MGCWKSTSAPPSPVPATSIGHWAGPSRYRVASEALCRRIIRGLGIYRLTTLIDVVNLVSIKSGYAISGLDGDRIVGDTLTMSVGTSDDVYNGIGRGLLNIEGMPVYRDAMGGIATPTSDEERTKFTDQTVTAQININAFAPEMPLEEAVDWIAALLKKYAHATNVDTGIYTPNNLSTILSTQYGSTPKY